MSLFNKQRNYLLVRKLLSCLIMIAFLATSLIPSVAFAQVLLPAPGTQVQLTSSFNPVLAFGLSIVPDKPLEFEFLLDKGSNKDLSAASFQKEAFKIVKYFISSLTTPEDEMWVNLSPYEPERIIPLSFGKTEMGRDLLAQDYMLKQLSSSLMSPENEIGKELWSKVNHSIVEQYGNTDIPIDIFNKIWIVPETAKLSEHAKGVVIVDTHLKVMLEEDYLALEHHVAEMSDKDNRGADLGLESKEIELQSSIIREIVIPAIEKEVNEGAIFANLRQIYNSMLLASWYKERLKESILGKTFVDKKKIDGLKISDSKETLGIYNQYVAALKQGAYEYIKEEYDPNKQRIIPKKYFSGGAVLKSDNAMLPMVSLLKVFEDVDEPVSFHVKFNSYLPSDELNNAMLTFDEAKQILQGVGWEHLLDDFDELDPQLRDKRLKQVEDIDWKDAKNLQQALPLNAYLL